MINLMRNEQFQNANAVFKGHLRDNTEKGLDVSVCKHHIDKQDIRNFIRVTSSPVCQKKVLKCCNIRYFSIYFTIFAEEEKRVYVT